VSRLLTEGDVAERLQVSPASVRRWPWSNLVPSTNHDIIDEAHNGQWTLRSGRAHSAALRSGMISETMGHFFDELLPGLASDVSGQCSACRRITRRRHLSDGKSRSTTCSDIDSFGHDLGNRGCPPFLA